MSAYVVFRRTKTIDEKELEKYWTGIQATMKGHPIEVLWPMESTKSLKVIRLRESSLRNSRTRKLQRIGIIARPTQRVAKHRKDGAIYHGLIVEGVS